MNCGPGLRVAGGYGALGLPKDLKPEDAAGLVYEPNAAAQWPALLDPKDFTPEKAVARAVAADRPVCLKVFVEPGFGGILHWPTPSAQTLAALHAEARRHGLPMVVHANSVEAWRAALDAHAEIIAHGLWHWDGDRAVADPPASARAVIEQAARQGVADQPTLGVLYNEVSVFDASLVDDPRFALAMPPKLIAYIHSDEAAAARRAVESQYLKLFPNAKELVAVGARRVSLTLGLMHEDGVHLLFGTDTPSDDGRIGNPPGLNGRLEMQRWAEAGVPLPQILRAATLDNAAAFGLAEELGSVEVGKKADLVLLTADPLKSVDAYDAIETIILDGRPIERAQLRPAD